MTEYKNSEVSSDIDLFIKDDLANLTKNRISDAREFVGLGVYSHCRPMNDQEKIEIWDNNLDNVYWLIQIMAQRYIDGREEYNSYKHGLRVMSQRSEIRLGFQDPPFSEQVPEVVIGSGESLAFLDTREVGEGGRTVFEKIKFVNPHGSFFFIETMYKLLLNIKETRIALINRRVDFEFMYLFQDIDRKQISDYNTLGTASMTV